MKPFMRDLGCKTEQLKSIAAETCICNELCEVLNNESCADTIKKA